MGKKATRFRNFLLALDEWTTVKFEHWKYKQVKRILGGAALTRPTATTTANKLKKKKRCKVLAYSGKHFDQFTPVFRIVKRSYVIFLLSDLWARLIFPCDCVWYGRPLITFIPSVLHSLLTTPSNSRPWSC